MRAHLDEARIQRLLHGQVKPAEVQTIREHLAVCPRCAQRVREWTPLFPEAADVLPQGEPLPPPLPGTAPRVVVPEGYEEIRGCRALPFPGSPGRSHSFSWWSRPSCSGASSPIQSARRRNCPRPSRRPRLPPPFPRTAPTSRRWQTRPHRRRWRQAPPLRLLFRHRRSQRLTGGTRRLLRAGKLRHHSRQLFRSAGPSRPPPGARRQPPHPPPERRPKPRHRRRPWPIPEPSSG